MLSRLAASPSRTLFALSGAVIIACFAHAWHERRLLSDTVWLFLLAFAAFAVFATRREPVMRLGAMLFAVVSGTLWLYDLALPSLTPPAGAEYRGIVAREPVARDGRTRFPVMDVTADGQAARVHRVTAREAPGVREGDTVVWRCLPPFGGDTIIEGFCTADGRVEVIGHDPHPFLWLRARLRTVARTMLPEPDASLLLGLIVGDRGGLPQALTDDFRATGTSHVLAVSGYNVALVIDAATVAFALLGLARRRAAVAVAVCVVGFTLLAGADPPVLRAGIMGSAGLLAALLGRKPHGGNAFVLAAALMLLADPLALRHDVSFRLSFFAVAGLSAFGSPLAARFTSIPHEGVRKALAETLGATIATLPIALHDFGSLAVASPVVNVLIAPLIPFATAVGAVGVAIAFLSSTLAFPATFAVAAALRLMRAIVGWWADAVPALEMHAGFAATVFLYAGLVILWYALKKKSPEV